MLAHGVVVFYEQHGRMHQRYVPNINETLAKHITRYEAGREILTPTKSAASILATTTSRRTGPIQDAWLVYQRALSVMKEKDVGHNAKRGLIAFAMIMG